MLFQNSIGIDIQAESFSLVALKDGFKHIRLAAHSTVAFEDGLNLNDRIRVIADAVNELSRNQGLGPADIFVAIPREHVLIREIKLPFSVKENLRTTLGYELPKYVPLAVDEIYFDYLVVDENRSQNTLRLLLFVIRKRDLDAYMPLAAHLGRNLGGIEISATAFAGFLEFMDQGKGQARRGLIQAGGKHAEISIFRSGLLEYSKPVQSADSHSDLAMELAESLQAAHDQFQGLDQSLKWAYYCLPGGEALISRLRVKSPLDIAEVNTGTPALPAPHLAVAYGLALKGLRNTIGRVNLLPEKLRRKPSRAGYYIMLGLALLVLILAGAWMGSHAVRYRLAVSRITDELTGLQAEVKEIENLLRQGETLEKQIQGIEKLRRQRISTLQILQELSQRIPPTAWIQEFSYQKGNVQITGLADSAREIVEILEDSPVFADVVFLSAITKNKDGKESFRIGMGLQ